MTGIQPTVRGSGSTAATGVIRKVTTTGANAVSGGIAGTVANAAVDIGKSLPFGALDWAKVQEETATTNAARSSKAVASATSAPMPMQQQNSMAIWAGLAQSIGPMINSLSGLFKGGGGGSDKPDRDKSDRPEEPPMRDPSNQNDPSMPDPAEPQDPSSPDPAQPQDPNNSTPKPEEPAQ